MCTIPENPKGDTTCTKCYNQDTGDNQCYDGQSRAASIVTPLYTKFGKNFGGVMAWASVGDQEYPNWDPGNPSNWNPTPNTEGTFSNPMNKAMGKPNRR